MASRARIVRLAIALIACAAPLAAGSPALAQDTSAVATPLLLEVEVNGRQTGLVVPFELRRTRLWSTAGELRALRLPIPDHDDDQWVALNDIAGLSYAYDEQSQTIKLTIAPGRLAATTLDLRAQQDGDADPAIDVAPGRSMVLRYGVVASGAHGSYGFSYSGVSAALDARYFSGSGQAVQTMLISQDSRGLRAMRLDSAWTKVDPARRRTWTIGDSITGATAWSRPIRFAGVQFSHDFSTRPDLVTVPLPGVSGTAAVPSSLDLYIDGMKRYSTTVPEGQFRIDDLPAVTGAGNARVVLRDLQGREIDASTPFFVSGRLLRAGLSEASVELGFARRSYGTQSFDYARSPIASASGRIGLRGGLTLDGHAEASSRLALIGAGATTPIAHFAVVSLAAAGSVASGGKGGLFYASVESGVGPIRFTLESRRTTPFFFDLAAVTSRGPGYRGAFGQLTSLQPSRASDRATFSGPVPFIGGSASVSYAREAWRGDRQVQTASFYYSRNIAWGASFNISAFHRFGGRGSGLFGGLSIPFGPRSVASVGVTRQDGETGVAVAAQRSLDTDTGSVGWRVAGVAGAHPFAEASVDYRGGAATVHADVAHRAGASYGSVAVEGAVVATGGSVFVRPRFDGGFAIVDAGASGVPVLSQNRIVGRTNRRGQFLVSDLRPYERNRIAVDPDALPVGRTVDHPAMTVRPSAMGGVRVSFAGKVAGRALHLVDEKGYDLPLGAEASINGGEVTVIGYDGLVFAPELARHNVLHASIGERQCVVQFDAADDARDQMASVRAIGPLVCRASSNMTLADNVAASSEGR